MPVPYPVIVVPGITGSELRDIYDVGPQTVFALLSKSFARVALHPDNLKYERIEPARVVPDKLIGMAYRELIEELRHDLKNKEDQPVGKVVTLGSPFRGSLEAPLKVTTGLAELGTGSVGSRERESARVTPALYHLLPSFDSAVNADPGIPDDLYNADAWQPNIVDTIAEYIRLYGLEKKDRQGKARALFECMLQEARTHRDRLESLRLSNAGLDEKDWLCIVGVDEETRVSLRVKKVRKKPEFDLKSADRKNLWKDQDPASRILTGDATVPYLGARCSFIPVEQIVCVRDNDFGYWELGDRSVEGLTGLHAVLPKMNLIHRLIVSHFTETKRHGTWGRPAPDIPGGVTWDPPIRGLKKKD